MTRTSSERWRPSDRSFQGAIPVAPEGVLR
jgi:hypothetical protein